MKEKVFRVNEINEKLIELYINCFKKDLIFNERMKSAIEDEETINKMLNYYILYGTILIIKRYSQIVSFLAAFDVKKIYNDKEAFDFFFNKKLFPEMYNYVKKNNFDCNYIVLIGVDEGFRNRGIASKLVKHYLRFYRSSNTFVTDVDNKYSNKIFKKFGFKSIRINKNYYIMEKKILIK